MATVCPLCKKGTLKKGDKMVYCDEYKPKKEGKDWINNGECEFHIPYNQKAFGRTLTANDIKKLVEGGTLKNAKGDTLELDIENTEFFTRITFAQRPEDKDL